MLNEKEIKDYFLLMNSHAKKELGQNFLTNEKVAQEIVQSLNIEPTDKILEIGPGLGALTEQLINKTAEYTVVEYDKKFVEFLTNSFSSSNIKIVNMNILKFKDFSYNKIIGNLPYYISTEILVYLIKNFTNFEHGVFMVQKEFFDRITTKNKRDKTPLNYYIEYMFDVKKILLVGKNNFFPQPTVESIVFSLTKKEEKESTFAGFLFKIIDILFLNRRKNINNNLKTLIKEEEIRKEIFTNLNLDSNLRCEDLNINDFEKITNEILKVRNLKL